MDLLSRGVHAYLLLAGGIVVLALVWGGNRFLLHNLAGEIGWSVLVGIAVLLTLAVVGLRRLYLSNENAFYQKRPGLSRRWNSRK